MATNKKMTIGTVKNCHILKMKQQAITAASQGTMPPTDRRNHEM
jgi:hypothetical protein